MAGYVSAEEYGPGDYVGLPGLFEYTNHDGVRTPVNCGQAAACTLLTHLGTFPPEDFLAPSRMAAVEEAHPPDNLGGRLGTSRTRIERILRAYGHEPVPVEGEAGLRDSLRDGVPVVVMIGMSARRLLGIPIPSGHWMVAYGYDERFVYLSNYGRMPWPEFRRGWWGLVARLIRMCNVGLTAVPASGARP